MSTTGDQDESKVRQEADDDQLALYRRNLHARVDNDFTNHPPTDVVIGRVMDEATARFLDLAHWLVHNVPAGREQSSALSALELVSFHTKAGIARKQDMIIAQHIESAG